jgi:amino acid transporter
MSFSLKRLLIGRPLETARAHEERLPKVLALPIFASDALSSTAYASEEIMAALLVAGGSHFYLTPRLSLGIIILLAIVVVSYRQIVMAYPGGGGAYIVAKDNLGELPAQTAGAALLLDYILTVAVSVSAGIAAITSLLKNYGHNIHEHTILLCLLAVALLTIANLRGVRESGAAFAIPTYTFIALMYALIGIGLYKLLMLHGLQPVHPLQEVVSALPEPASIGTEVEPVTKALTPFLLMRAFASGCTALTGVEAISNGVTAFKEPASKNASTVMTWMAAILGTLFMGLSYLAVHVNALPPTAAYGDGGETVLSQVGRSVFGTGPFYLLLQITTCTILILAANTSFAGFPRLCAIQAADGFLPRQLANIGDKLVFNNGILILAVLSSILVVIFHGDVHYLIPLYAVGVFLSFTLSQAGMVKRWVALKSPGWQWKVALNGFGAAMTCVVMFIFGLVKFAQGAWVVIFLIPTLVFIFFRIKGHYRSVARQLSLEGYRPRQGLRHHVLVLAPDIHQGVIPALQYARTISEDAKALHISIDPTREKRVRERFTLWSRGVPLVILPSPYRSLVDPILQYIDRLQQQEPNCLVTVVIPEFVPTGWWPKLLHGQAGLLLSLRLRFKPGVVVTTVPYHIQGFVNLAEDASAGPLGYTNGHAANGIAPQEGSLNRQVATVAAVASSDGQGVNGRAGAASLRNAANGAGDGQR